MKARLCLRYFYDCKQLRGWRSAEERPLWEIAHDCIEGFGFARNPYQGGGIHREADKVKAGALARAQAGSSGSS